MKKKVLHKYRTPSRHTALIPTWPPLQHSAVARVLRRLSILASPDPPSARAAGAARSISIILPASPVFRHARTMDSRRPRLALLLEALLAAVSLVASLPLTS